MTDDTEEPADEPASSTENGDRAEEAVVRGERFSGGPARSFLSSLAADERIFDADIAVDRAHVVMLAEQDIIEETDAAAILEALDEVATAGHAALPQGEDVHEAIETAVIDRVGPDGGRMHTARSRNDEVAACIRYRLRMDITDLLTTLVEGREELLDTAATHTETVMPGYTHLQPAQPTTVAHWLCSYEAALARDTRRLLDAYDRVNQSPLGAAAFAGTTFDIDRERTAALLGFDGLVENSMDAVSARDFLVESVAAVAGVGVTLSGFATDGIEFASRGYLDLDDDYASTSSIMPQKKNPDTLELVRGRTGDAAAGFSGLLTALTGLPRAYNRDLQRVGPHAWDAIDSVSESVPVAIGAITTGAWDETALEAVAGDGFSTATGVADLLAQSGVPFRTAHEVVTCAATEGSDAAALDAAARDILGESLWTYVDRQAVERALDPAASVASRDSRGGPATDTVETHIERARQDLETDRDVIRSRLKALGEAQNELDTEVSKYA